MHVTYPLIAALFAMGFSAPLGLRRPDDWPILSWRLGALTIVAVMFAFLAGPPLISLVVRSMTAFDAKFAIDHEDLRVVPGGRSMTGFLVLPDVADLPRKEPALHASTFARMIPNILLTANPTYLVGDYPLYRINPESSLSELLPQVPFALIYSPAQNSPNIFENYLTIPTVLTDKSPQRWLIRLDQRSITSNAFSGLGFRFVDDAKLVE